MLAAASLTDVYEEMATTFEEANDAEVTFSFGSSTDLAEQVADGAPGDVLATADEASMQVAEDAGVTGDVETFADQRADDRDPARQPGRHREPRRPRRCDVGPVRRRGALRRASPWPCSRPTASPPSPRAWRTTSRATLDKVTSGEAEAGLVYATDAVAAGDGVATRRDPGRGGAADVVPHGHLEQSEDADLARAWVDHVCREEGQIGARRRRVHRAVSRREGHARPRPRPCWSCPAALATLLLTVPARSDGGRDQLARPADPAPV